MTGKTEASHLSPKRCAVSREDPSALRSRGRQRKSIAVSDHASARERLIDAAIALFGAQGFEGASTRELAKKANVNIASILYYFGGKDGLYNAVLATISERVVASLAGPAEAARRGLAKKDLTWTEAQALLHQVLTAFLGFLMGEAVSPAIGRLFMREQMDPTPGFAPLYKRTIQPLHALLTGLVARLIGRRATSADAILATHAVLGTVTIYKTHRELALRRLGWKSYGPRETAQVTAIVLRHVDYVLEGYRASREKK
jgi:AcrR family transcriptional regulator